jgi:hypothetical protein
METNTLVSKLTGVDFSIILDGMLDIVPIVIPVVLGFIAFRKGYTFLKKQIKGA